MFNVYLQKEVKFIPDPIGIITCEGGCLYKVDKVISAEECDVLIESFGRGSDLVFDTTVQVFSVLLDFVSFLKQKETFKYVTENGIVLFVYCPLSCGYLVCNVYKG